MEQLLLGYFLNHPEESLKVEDEIFEDEQLRKIFCVLKDRQANKKAVTPDFIAKESKTFFDVSALLQLMQNNIWDKSEYQEYLAEHELKRRLKIYDRLFSKSFEDFTAEKEPAKKLAVLTELKEKISRLNTSVEKYKIKTNPQLGNEWLENYGKPIEYKAKTGITGIDQAIGGLKGTELVLIIADTGIGKTNLMLNMAHNILKTGKSILFFSLEMSDEELMDRLIPIVGDLNAFEVRERIIKKDKVEQTVLAFKNYDMRIIYAGSVTSNDVVAEMINNPADVVMLDYLQRLNDDKGRDNEMERLKGIVRKLKNACLNLQIPIFTPAQVDKASSKSDKIRVENVAGAKDIANEADLAFYLYEKKIENKSMIIPDEFEMFLEIVKSRHSMKGTKIKINFNKFNLRMTDMQDGLDLNQI